MFRVIIAGGRDFENYSLMKEKCDLLLSKKEQKEIIIISGMAKGADSLALRYASERNIKVQKFPADWNAFGKSAGYRRNQEMANNADALIAFWNNQSKGTKHMIDIAKAKGLKVKVISY